MAFKDIFKFNKSNPIPVNESGSSTSRESFGSMSFSMETDLPVIKELRNRDWVEYGSDNLYPQYLQKLYNTSPTHQAIVKTKALMVAGNGYTIDDSHLDESRSIEALKIINQVMSQMNDTALDQQIYGAFAYEIVWTLDFKKIIRVNRVDPACLRSGKYVNNFIDKWYYSRDWSNRHEEIKEIWSYEEADGENIRQLLYVPSQMVSNEYYAEPSYLAAIDWINLEASTGLYYKSLIENGFNPSMVVNFYRKPKNKEERDQIVSGLKKSYSGVKNAGKMMAIFSDGKELAPSIEPIQVSGVDKQFTVIADQIQQKIMIGERITSTEIIGLNYAGSLGQGDFDQKMKVFQKIVIRPEQKIIEDTVNKILLNNGINVDFKIKPFSFNEL